MTVTIDTLQLLHIDDSPSCLELFQCALEECCPCAGYQGATDPVAALAELGRLAANGLPLPDVIVLDINMPAMRGQDVLAVLSHHPVLKLVPVAMLTCTAQASEIAECRALGAREVYCKPLRFSEMTGIVRAILERAAR